MRVLGSKDFLEKFEALDKTSRAMLAPIFELISKMNKDEFCNFQQRTKVLVASKDIFVYKVKDYRLFYTLTKEKEETVILFIDIVKRAVFPQKHYIKPVPSRDPRSNFNINPMSNFNINPRSNFNLNPRSNFNINPMSNFNINPKSNFNLNPRSNPYMSPVGNPAFSGPIVYDLDLNTKYFLVRASEEITLFFDFDLNWQLFAVKANNNPKIFLIFNLSNDWAGYMVSDGADGFNYFDLKNEWRYFVK